MSKSSVQRLPLPGYALLAKFARGGAYTDCYVVAVPRHVSHAEYVEAFYTSWLFKLERVILTWFVEKPSTDDEARALSRGERETFAAWSVDSRAGNQLVMLDFMSYTCSWLMIETRPAETVLYFGSGIMRRTLGFRLLLPFHKLYARSLLAAAGAQLRRRAAY